MASCKNWLTTALCLLLPATVIADGDTKPDPSAIDAAVVKALALIEKSTAEYRDNRTCFSCHHQAAPTLALVEARTHGYKIDEDNLQTQLKWTADHLRRGRAGYAQGRGQGGGVDTASWGLWTLQVGDWQPDDTTEAVVEYLLRASIASEHWRGTSTRPPTQASDVSRTATILAVLDSFASDKQQPRLEELKTKARRWLMRAPVLDTEDKVGRLRGLSYLNEDADLLLLLAADLVLDQREDGGWGQRPGMKSDAYATGTALVALHHAGVPASDSVYRRGLDYLLKTQLDDGSWHVVTRSRPIQVYFESGFPHGKDQFISIAATCWAAQALMLGK
jgi:N-acyl-D-amino-acid deacylase